MRKMTVDRWAGTAALVSLGAITVAPNARANVPPYLTEQGRLFDLGRHPDHVWPL